MTNAHATSKYIAKEKYTVQSVGNVQVRIKHKSSVEVFYIGLLSLRISAGFKCVEVLGRIIIGGPYPPSNAIIRVVFDGGTCPGHWTSVSPHWNSVNHP